MAPVTFSIDALGQGNPIPTHFAGLSFEAGSERSGNVGTSGYMFRASNTQLVTLFKNIALKNLRVGGGSVDTITPPGLGSDGFAGIDNLFAFARQAGVRVIYSLRMLGSTTTHYQSAAAVVGGYVWSNYQSQLDYFAVGNEPNFRSYHYPPAGTGPDPRIVYYESIVTNQGYLEDWNEFAAAVTAAAPGATFGGPDTGEENGKNSTWWNGMSWTQNFVEDKTAGNITVPIIEATQHNYPGGSDTNLSIADAISNMLSANWAASIYPQFFGQITGAVAGDGWNWRMTECNPFTGGVFGADNAFASALWALDYMHWQAAQSPRCGGVNFHNKQWIATDTIYLDTDGNYQANPKGCGIRAFDLGSHGNVMTNTSLSNPDGINLTAYAVGDASNLYATVVNKTGAGTAAVNANVTITPSSFKAASGEYIMLDSLPASDAAASAATLGGVPITNNAAWQGTWTPLTVGAGGQCALTVKSSSAAIVHLAGSLVSPIPICIQLTGQKFVLTWNDPAASFSLQSAPAANGLFTNISGAMSPYTNSLARSAQFFRLVAH